jgi:NADP-dependent 3-hydroxy acid dehydrogenase YdfG
VVATARDPSSIPALADVLCDDVTRLALDVSDRSQRDTAVREVVERFGRIDVLVTNAGRMYLGAVEERSDDELRAMFDLHVFGPTELVRLVLPLMRKQRRGTIVQMSSMGAFLIAPGTSCYTAAKAAPRALRGARGGGRAVWHRGADRPAGHSSDGGLQRTD